MKAKNQYAACIMIAESDLSESIVGYDFDVFDLCGLTSENDNEYCMARLSEHTVEEHILGALMFTCNGRGPESGFFP